MTEEKFNREAAKLQALYESGDITKEQLYEYYFDLCERRTFGWFRFPMMDEHQYLAIIGTLVFALFVVFVVYL